MSNKPDGFKQSVITLLATLERLPPARSIEEAHQQISEHLHAIEDARRGCPKEAEMQIYGIQRLAFWPLEKIYWGDLEGDSVSCRFGNGHWISLYRDGAMLITKGRHGEQRVVFRKDGARLRCEHGHFLSDHFGRGTPACDIDDDYACIAYMAAQALGSCADCPSCQEIANTFLAPWRPAS